MNYHFLNSGSMAAFGVLLLLILPLAAAGTVHFTSEVIALDDRFINCPDEPIHGASLEPAADGKAYLGMAQCGTAFHYTAEQAFTISGDLVFSMFVSCDTAAGGLGTPSIPEVGYLRPMLATLLVNDQGMGDADTQEAWTCTGDTDVFEFSGTIPVDTTAVAPGDVIKVELNVYDYKNNPGNEVPNVHVKTGSGFQSGFDVTGIPGGDAGDGPTGPVEVVENVTTEALGFNHSWATPRNATHIFNWNNTFSDLDLEIVAAPENGTATVTIEDSANETLYEAQVEGNITLEESFADVATGNWTVTVLYESYVGDLELALAEGQGGEGNGTDDTGGSDGDAGGSENGTDDGSDGADGNNATDGADDGEESPGFTVAAIGAALFAVVAVMRRRRA